MVTANATRVDKHRVDTLLSFLPAMHKLDRAGVQTNDTYTFVNDSVTKTFLLRSLPLIDDTLFDTFPKKMSETVADILSFLNSTLTTVASTNDSFTYDKLLSVLTGSFDAMLKEIEAVIKQGNGIDIK